MNAHNEQQALPCPFCGREPDLSFNSVSCGCAASPFIDREDALQVWNTRAAQPSPVVKQNLTTQPAAAQEAVAVWTVTREGDPTFPRTYFSEAAADAMVAHVTLAPFAVKHASVTAAPTLDDELAQDRMSELSKLERDVLDALPAVYYMDPPDGGDVSLGEQVKRMAEDAALWRKHISTPAAPGIDMGVPGATLTIDGKTFTLDKVRAALLIDASPKGDHPVGTPMMPDGKFYDGCWERLPKGMQQHGRMLTQSWRVADSTELKLALEAGVLALMDSSNGGSEARDAERYRKLRRVRSNPYAVLPVGEALDAHVDAMQAQAGDAEAQRGR